MAIGWNERMYGWPREKNECGEGEGEWDPLNIQLMVERI